MLDVFPESSLCGDRLTGCALSNLRLKMSSLLRINLMLQIAMISNRKWVARRRFVDHALPISTRVKMKSKSQAKMHH